jgi:cytochrome b561
MSEVLSKPIDVMTDSNPSLISRLLHMTVASGVILQLLLSTVMQMPKPGAARTTLESLTFTFHEVVGLSLAVLITGWLVWLMLRPSTEPKASELFPWTSRVGRQALLEAFRLTLEKARRGRLAPESEVAPLALTVHGLGLLCIAFMALSGTLVWLGMSDTGAMTDWAKLLLNLHHFTANLVWIYLAGHAGMAVLHQWNGERTLTRMFSLRS